MGCDKDDMEFMHVEYGRFARGRKLIDSDAVSPADCYRTLTEEPECDSRQFEFQASGACYCQRTGLRENADRDVSPMKYKYGVYRVRGAGQGSESGSMSASESGSVSASESGSMSASESGSMSASESGNMSESGSVSATGEESGSTSATGEGQGSESASASMSESASQEGQGEATGSESATGQESGSTSASESSMGSGGNRGPGGESGNTSASESSMGSGGNRGPGGESGNTSASESGEGSAGSGPGRNQGEGEGKTSGEGQGKTSGPGGDSPFSGEEEQSIGKRVCDHVFRTKKAGQGWYAHGELAHDADAGKRVTCTNYSGVDKLQKKFYTKPHTRSACARRCYDESWCAYFYTENARDQCVLIGANTEGGNLCSNTDSKGGYHLHALDRTRTQELVDALAEGDSLCN